MRKNSRIINHHGNVEEVRCPECGAVMARKYSVSEIDEMRGYLLWMSNLGLGKDVEDRLRTYMLNGTKPEELKEAHERAFERWRENQRVAGEQMKAFTKARGEQQ